MTSALSSRESQGISTAVTLNSEQYKSVNDRQSIRKAISSYFDSLTSFSSQSILYEGDCGEEDIRLVRTGTKVMPSPLTKASAEPRDLQALIRRVCERLFLRIFQKKPRRDRRVTTLSASEARLWHIDMESQPGSSETQDDCSPPKSGRSGITDREVPGFSSLLPATHCTSLWSDASQTTKSASFSSHHIACQTILPIFRVAMASSSAMESPRNRNARRTNKRAFSERERDEALYMSDVHAEHMQQEANDAEVSSSPSYH